MSVTIDTKVDINKNLQSSQKTLVNKILKHKQLYIMMIPGLLILIIYKYLPMGGLIISFKDYYPGLGLLGSKWVGLKHFMKLFQSPSFWHVFRNTLLLSLYKLAIGFPIPILLAILLNELRNIKYKRVVQTVFYLPHFLSWVIFGGMVINILSMGGPINLLIQLFGGEPIMFLTNVKYFRSIVVFSDIIKSSGWGTIVYLAAITGVDPALYEAAIVDGAGRFRRIWHITLPAIRGTIIILLILRIGHILDVGFQQILMLYNPAVYDVADVFGTYVYRVGITQGNYSFTTAVGLFKGVIGLLLVIGANKLAKKMKEPGVW